MERKTFVIECILGAEFECFIVRDRWTGADLKACRDGEELAAFLREAKESPAPVSPSGT